MRTSSESFVRRVRTHLDTLSFTERQLADFVLEFPGELATPATNSQNWHVAPKSKIRVRVTEIFRVALARRTIPLCLSIWMTYGAQISVSTLMPTILVGLGYSISKSLLFTMVMQGGSLLGAIAASLLGFRFPRKRVLPGARSVRASFGIVGVFGMVAAMYAVFVISIQSVPETYGESPDALPLPGESAPAVDAAPARAG